MADAGGIIGAISLALQVLQGLSWYYSSFTAFHDEIAAVVQHAGLIENNLNLLSVAVQKLNREDGAISTAVQTNITTCEDAIRRLKKHLDKCGSADCAPDTLRRKVVLVKRRMAYPFKKNTLEDIQSQLFRLTDSLQVITQTLQLDTTADFHGKTTSQIDVLHTEVMLVRGQQTYQTKLLERVDKLLAQYASSPSQHDAHMETIAHAHTEQLNTIENGINRLMNSISQIEQTVIQTKTLPSPGILKESCDNYIKTTQDIQRLNDTAVQMHSGIARHALAGLKCYCPKNLRRRPALSHQRWFATFYVKESRHLPQCPLYLSSQSSVVFGLRVRACLGALQQLVEANVVWSNKSISPRISTRNLVSRRSSPGFLLVLAYTELYFGTRPPHSLHENPTIENYFESATSLLIKSLVQLLKQNRIGVRDADCDDGRSIFHYFMSRCGFWLSRIIHLNITFLHESIECFRDMGFDLNESTTGFGTPASDLLSCFNYGNGIGANFEQLGKVPIFHKLEYSMKDIVIFPLKSYAHTLKLHRYLSGSVDGEITKAICQQSLQELDRYLSLLMKGTHEEDISFCLHLSSQWPHGIRQLLKYGFDEFSVRDKSGLSALDWAVQGGNLESVELLLPFIGLWTENTLRVSSKYSNGTIARSVANWAFMHTEHASTTTKQEDPVYIKTFFFYKYMIPDFADLLFDVGFKNVDLPFASFQNPLWKRSYMILYPNDLRLLIWFTSKGAKLDFSHDRFKIMPLHLIVERIMWLMDNRTHRIQEDWRHFLSSCERLNFQPGLKISHLDGIGNLESEITTGDNRSSTVARFDGPCGSSLQDSALEAQQQFLVSVFGNQATDGCSCFCAVGGCTALSSAMKTRLRGPVESTEYQRRVLCILWEHFLRLTSYEDLYRAAIRAMTFQGLGLTHTCHEIIHNPLSEPQMPLSEEMINDIHHSESSDIDLLEELVVEFEEKWKPDKETIFQFIDGYWMQRMEGIWEERQRLCENEKKKLEELGVIVTGFGPELPTEVENLSGTDPLDPWERYQKRVEGVMSGQITDFGW